MMTKKRRTRSAPMGLPASGVHKDLLLAPMVMAMRMPILLAEAASGKASPGEAHKAVTEKVMAGVEGAMAMQASMLKSAMDFWPGVLRGRHPSDLMANSVVKAGNEALKPASRAVRNNFDRLRKP